MTSSIWYWYNSLRMANCIFQGVTGYDFQIKVRRKAKIRNWYNQVPDLTQDTVWESDKNTTKRHKQERQDVSPFLAGVHKATRHTQRHIQIKLIHKRSNALERSVRELLEGFNYFNGSNFTLNYDMEKNTPIFGSHERPLTHSLIISIVLTNSVDRDEMPHYVAFYLDINCLQNYENRSC